MDKIIENSNVILCPLYGDIKTDWNGNVRLIEHMFNWPIYVSNDNVRLKEIYENSYISILKALNEFKGFTFYVGLEVDKNNQKFVFWNSRFQVHVYLEKEKLFELQMTGFDDGFLWGHFDGKCFDVGQRTLSWEKNNWFDFFKLKIKEKIDELSSKSLTLSREVVKLNQLKSKIAKVV